MILHLRQRNHVAQYPVSLGLNKLTPFVFKVLVPGGKIVLFVDMQPKYSAINLDSCWIFHLRQQILSNIHQCILLW